MKITIVGISIALCCTVIGSRADAHWEFMTHDENGEFRWIHHYHDNQYYLGNETGSAVAAAAGEQEPTAAEDGGVEVQVETPIPLHAAMIAATNPANQAVAAKSFCYCGCDKQDGHRSLLDCYRTGHIPTCSTCQNEFIRVGELNKAGETIGQIQHQIDQEFSSAYPYPEPSPALQQYQASRDSSGTM